jgi:FKBP-type peptidyl-prolyl cis-trans isomerase FkpA
MKHLSTAGLSVVLVAAFGACQAGPSADLESFEGRSSYAVGADIGTNLKQTGVELELSGVMAGISDALEGREIQLTDEEMREVLQELSTRMQTAQQQQFEEATERNIAEGQAYLAENGQREGVVTTASGLQYEVLTQGTGPRPSATDQVSVNYRGTLVDGTEFDSSYERGEPVTFPINQVIAGWTEALQLMPVGSKYRFVIPSNLAYGERGSGPVIGPNSTLTFEVELMAIVGR